MDERLVDSDIPDTELGPLRTSLEVSNNQINDPDGESYGDARLLADSYAARPQEQQTNSRPPGSIKPKKLEEDPYQGYAKLCVSGLMLIVGAFIVHFIDPVQIAREMTMVMQDGSYLFGMWKAPPIKLYIKVYMFNITNAERFMKGYDKKLKVNEIGPYTYSEVVTNEEIVWNDNETLSFTPQRTVQFERELSVGDPGEDIFIVPNIPLLGMASMLANSSMTVNLAISTLISYLDSQPLLKMPIKSFLWGYDDPLVKLAQNVLPSWITFTQFGLLDRMMDEGVNRITMSLKNTNKTKQFSIQKFNGLSGLKVWGYDEGDDGNSTSCNRVEGTHEGYLFPRDIPAGTQFTIYRKAFCRPLRLQYRGEGIHEKWGYPVFNYGFPDDILDPNIPENVCYCDRNKGPCLPSGVTDLSPCYYNIPVAISLPHFLKAPKFLVDAVEGISPDLEKHDTILSVQPSVGVPVMVKTRLQLNIVVKKTKFIPRIRPFNNLIIPVFWMDVELLGLPFSVNFLMVLLLQIGPPLQKWGIICSVGIGLLLVFLANLRYAWRSGIFSSRRRTATLISYRKKQRQEVIWRSGRYFSLLGGNINPELPPPATNQDARIR